MKVWVSDPTGNSGGKRKLGWPYKGPGTVIRSLRDDKQTNVYRVRMPDGKESNLHHDRLKPFVEYRTEHSEVKRTEVQGEKRMGFAPSSQPHETLLPPHAVRDMILGWEAKLLPSESRIKVPYVTKFGRTVKPVTTYQA